MKYKEWLDEWLESYTKVYLKARTYRNYEGIIKNHISPLLGDYELEDLKFSVLHSFVIDREQNAQGRYGKGLAGGTVELIINVLQKSLEMAVEMDKVDHHYASRLRRPKTQNSETDCFTLTEQKMIEDAILCKMPNKKIGILISLYTGLRLGELLALRWDDIDFESCSIKVNHTTRETYPNGKRQTVLETPKTVSSKRIIPVPNQLIRYLLLMKSVSKSDFVVATKGGATTSRSYQKLYTALLSRLGIKYRSFHTLRHTFATRALECGMDVKTLSEIMGHKSPTVTLNRYSHSLTEHKIAMMNRLGKNLDREDTEQQLAEYDG